MISWFKVIYPVLRDAMDIFDDVVAKTYCCQVPAFRLYIHGRPVVQITLEHVGDKIRCFIIRDQFGLGRGIPQTTFVCDDPENFRDKFNEAVKGFEIERNNWKRYS